MVQKINGVEHALVFVIFACELDHQDELLVEIELRARDLFGRKVFIVEVVAAVV